MTKALVRVMRRAMPLGGGRGPLRNVPPAVIRFLVGAECANDVHVPRAAGNRALFDLLQRFGSVIAAADKAFPVFSVALEQLGRWQLNAVFNAQRTKSEATFAIPTQLEPRMKRPLRKAVRKAAAGT
jgi:hypothetical protein